MQRLLFYRNDCVNYKDNLHHRDQQEDLHNLAAINVQGVVLVDDQTCDDRANGGAQESKESIEASGAAALVLGHIISDDRAPGGVGHVIGNLQEEEQDNKGDQQFGRGEPGRCKGEKSQDNDIEDRTNDHKRSEATHAKGNVIGKRAYQGIDNNRDNCAPDYHHGQVDAFIGIAKKFNNHTGNHDSN